MARAFYRIKRSDWPLTGTDDDGNPTTSRADSVALGGTAALLIVQSSIHPNPALEALAASKFLGHTYADLLANPLATATQKGKIFRTSYLTSTGGARRGRSGDIPSTAPVVKANLIPHSWGAKEGVIEQAAVDDLE